MIKAAAIVLFLLSSLVFAKDEKKTIIAEITSHATQVNRYALDSLERRFLSLQIDLEQGLNDPKLSDENAKLTNELSKEVQKILESSLVSQERTLKKFGLKELKELQLFLTRHNNHSQKLLEIQDLDAKVTAFFKSGDSQKVPEAKLTLINSYYFDSKEDEISKTVHRAGRVFIKKNIGRQNPKATKKEIEDMTLSIERKAVLNDRMRFLYSHNLMSDEELKADLDFFKTNAFKRYVDYQTKNSRSQAEVFMKFASKLVDRIEKAEKKKKK